MRRSHRNRCPFLRTAQFSERFFYLFQPLYSHFLSKRTNLPKTEPSGNWRLQRGLPSARQLLPPADAAVLCQSRIHLSINEPYLAPKPVVWYPTFFPLPIYAGDGQVQIRRKLHLRMVHRFGFRSADSAPCWDPTRGLHGELQERRCLGTVHSTELPPTDPRRQIRVSENRRDKIR